RRAVVRRRVHRRIAVRPGFGRVAVRFRHRLRLGQRPAVRRRLAWRVAVRAVGGPRLRGGLALMAGTVVHYGFSNPQYHGLVERYATARGLGCRHVHITTSMFQAASVLKHAALVVIWNGMQAQGPQAARLCRRRGIPHVFFEWGMLPQSETFLVDPSGFCGDSVLCRDLGWVTDADMDRMLERRDELRERYPRTDEGFVLVPLQILNDTQVLYHTDLKDMTELVRRVAELYPDREIVVRPHPKSNGKVPAEWFG